MTHLLAAVDGPVLAVLGHIPQQVPPGRPDCQMEPSLANLTNDPKRCAASQEGCCSLCLGEPMPSMVTEEKGSKEVPPGTQSDLEAAELGRPVAPPALPKPPGLWGPRPGSAAFSAPVSAAPAWGWHPTETSRAETGGRSSAGAHPQGSRAHGASPGRLWGTCPRRPLTGQGWAAAGLPVLESGSSGRASTAGTALPSRVFPPPM